MPLSIEFWSVPMPKIGMSDCGEKNRIYEKFLLGLPGSEVVVIAKGMEDELRKCDALVLTGGPDVAPELYGDWADETVTTDPERDGSEYRLIDYAFNRQMPMLGICRGLQILNVFFGGTLIIDLGKYYGRNHKALSNTEDRTHGVILQAGSLIKEFIRQESGMVNSAHHQAADRIGRGLKVVARAEDGTVEAIEGNGDLPGRIVAVQWHPERIQNGNPFAQGVLELFGSCVSQYHNSENYAHGG